MTREEVGNSIFKELPNTFEPGNPMVEDLYVVTPRGVDLIWSWMVDERLARREAEARVKELEEAYSDAMKSIATHGVRP